MEANESFALTWCWEHKNWYQYNCPDCMVNSNEEGIKQEGRREVADYFSRHWMGQTRGMMIYEIPVKDRPLLEDGIVPDPDSEGK